VTHDAEARQRRAQAAQQEAEERTAALDQQIKALDEILSSALALPPWTFERLMAAPKDPPFTPGPLGTAAPGPDWDDYAPDPPRGLSRLLGGSVRYKRQLAAARARFAAAEAEHQRAESERKQALAVAKARYDREVTQQRARTAKRNSYIARRRSAFATGDTESVEWFVGGVLNASRYPDGFPRRYQVTYQPERREVTVEFELPPPEVVPAERGYRYLATRDLIEPLPRPAKELRQRYQQLTARVTLRTLHEIFSATGPDVVQAVAFHGRVATVDPATGKPDRPHLLSVSADRSAFEDLVLAAVDPVACLAHLNALISPGPVSPFDPQPA
jgi:restriction system protein